MVKCCIRLDDCVSSFTPKLCLACCACEDLCDSFPAFFAPSVTWGFVCWCVQVRWRKPAGTRRFAEAIEEPTRRACHPAAAGGHRLGRSPGTRPPTIWFRSRVQTASKRGGRRKKNRKQKMQQTQICRLAICRCCEF